MLDVDSRHSMRFAARNFGRQGVLHHMSAQTSVVARDGKRDLPVDQQFSAGKRSAALQLPMHGEHCRNGFAIDQRLAVDVDVAAPITDPIDRLPAPARGFGVVDQRQNQCIECKALKGSDGVI